MKRWLYTYHQVEPKPPKPSTQVYLNYALFFYHETKFEPIFHYSVFSCLFNSKSSKAIKFNDETGI